MKYNVSRHLDDRCVSITLEPYDSQLNAFLDIYLDFSDDDEPQDSPFENLDDAEAFAKMIVKLLEQIT